MSSTSVAAENSTKSLFLWTAGTPNGHKPSILLEELKAAYPGELLHGNREVHARLNNRPTLRL